MRNVLEFMNSMRLNTSLFSLIFVAIFSCGCAKSDPIVAKVAGLPITLSEFNARLEQTPEKYQWHMQRDVGQRQFLDILVREKMLYALAQRRGLARDEEVRKALKDFKRDQNKELQEFREGILVSKFLEELRGKELQVTDEETVAYHKARPYEYQARHILFATEQEAQKALERLKQGESFSKLARELSLDPVSSQDGGSLGKIRPGELPKELETALANLKIGEFSGVLPSPFGYHILQKTNEQPMNFEEAREDIRRILEREKFESWLDGEKKNLTVKVREDVLKSVAWAENQEGKEHETIP